MQVERLILRFRDLVTTPGDTIELHKSISERHGSVWWGWWHKPGPCEQVPADLFLEWVDVLKSGNPKDCFLLDSGRLKVYKVVLHEIAYGGRKSIPSPALDQTPEYYNDQQYLAWFRLSLFEEVEPVELCSWTYTRVDSFYSNGPSIYNQFYDKQVASPAELAQQNRTVWFVRRFDASVDRTGEISLVDARQFSPNNFPGHFAPSHSFRLLWLSDLHFWSPDAEDYEDVDENGVALTPMQREVLAWKKSIHAFRVPSQPLSHTHHTLHNQVVSTLREAGISDIAGVLVSGDITWQGLPAEYGHAGDCLRSILSEFGLDSYHLAVCPGNHDLPFSDAADEKAAPLKDVATAGATAAFRDFYQKLFYIPPEPSLASGRRYLLGGAVAVEVACLNTSYLEQHKDLFQGHGFVGDEQMKLVREKMGWDKPRASRRRPYRILMMHHHMLPISRGVKATKGASFTTPIDAEAIQRWGLSCEIDLVVHGHMHEAHYAKLTRRQAIGSTEPVQVFDVASLGSAGVIGTHLPPTESNQFAVLDFGGHGVEITYYRLNPGAVERSPYAKIALERRELIG